MAALQLAVESLRVLPGSPGRDLVYAARLVDLGWMHIRLGELARARSTLEESHALFEAHSAAPVPGQSSDPVLGLGMVALLEGRYDDAARLGEVALRGAGVQAASNRPRALFVLARAAHAQGNYRSAREHAENALAAASELGHSWLVASLHNELGNTLCAMGEYAEATHHYRTYFALREAFDDRRGMATALTGLGRVALCEGRTSDASTLFERSLGLLRQVGAQLDTSMTLDGLSAVAAAEGNTDQARRYLAEALELALASAGEPLLLTVLTSAAELLLATDRAMWGAEAVVLVQHHHAIDHQTRERAARVRELYERELPAELLAAAVRRGQRGTLRQFTPQLQAILAIAIRE